MRSLRRLLIVDDERNVHYSFRRALEDEYEIVSAHDGIEALETVEEARPDAVLLDVRLPRLGGLDTLERIHGLHPEIPVIVMTAFGTVDTAIRATALSAREYLLKPIDVPTLKKLLDEVIPEPQEPEGVQAFVPSETSIVGQSSEMEDLFKVVGRAAGCTSTVLVTGESGTGKELIARAIHDHSRRSRGPFLTLNCAAIPAALLESEIFGHEKGAFTGAHGRRAGKFELAHGGTLVLDEIGEMDAPLQAKLLRVLQSCEVTPLGSVTSQSYDVRVIALTNVDLEARVASGSFREDLYYRLNVLRIQVPPLRERDGDIWLLANRFLERERGRLGRPDCRFTPDCEAWLAAHHWPGNVRELENAVSQALLNARGSHIRPADFTIRVPGGNGSSSPRPSPLEPFVEGAIDSFFESHPGEAWMRLDKIIFERALALSGGNQVHAARLLGVSRNVLRKRMSMYSI